MQRRDVISEVVLRHADAPEEQRACFLVMRELRPHLT